MLYLLMELMDKFALGSMFFHLDDGIEPITDKGYTKLSCLDNIPTVQLHPLPISLFNVKKGPRKDVRQGSRSGLLTLH